MKWRESTWTLDTFKYGVNMICLHLLKRKLKTKSTRYFDYVFGDIIEIVYQKGHGRKYYSSGIGHYNMNEY